MSSTSSADTDLSRDHPQSIQSQLPPQWTHWQINMHGSQQAMDILSKHISEEAVEIISVSDPAWVLRRGWAPPGYVSIRPQIQEEDDVLALLLIKANLSFKTLFLPDARVAGVVLKSNRKDWFFLSVYIQPNTGMGFETISTLLRNTHNSQQTWFIAGDFNSRHPRWGPEDTPETNKAAGILDLCDDFHLAILNEYPCPPTFRSPNGQSWIDLTLCSQNLAESSTWTVREDLISLSDHQIVETKLWHCSRPPKNASRQNWRKADWPAIRNSVKEALEGFPEATHWRTLNSSEGFDSHSKLFIELIQEAARPHVPLSGARKPRKHWWNDELDQLYRVLKRALRRREKHRSRFGWTPDCLEDAVSDAKAHLKHNIRKNKREAWREFLSSNSGTQSDMWQTVRKITQAQKRPTLDFVQSQNGEILHDPADIAAALQSKFFPTPEDVYQDNPCTSATPLPRMHMGNIPQVSEIEARKAFGCGRPLAAPGPDGLPKAIFQRCMHSLSPQLKELASASLQFGICPHHWKLSQVIALHKGNNPGNEVGKLRPISLLNTLAKGMETLVAARLKYWSEKNMILDPSQFGFRPGKSTTDALLTASDWIAEQMQNGDIVYGVALDLVAAFDSISRAYLVQTLIRLEAPPYLIHWCSSFLQDRKAELQISDSIFTSSTLAGVPQGSPLSPLLFILGINAALQIPKDTGVHLQAYADDILLLCSANSEELARHKAQKTLDLLVEWSRKAGMQFSEKKCLAIRFQAKVRRAEMLPLYLGSAKLRAVKSCRYLGMILDERLTWKPHLQFAQQRARERLAIIRRFSAKTWGFSPEAMWQLTTKALEPALYYGAEALSRIQNSPQHLSILNRVVRQAGLLISGCLRTTSYEAVFALAGLLPAQMEIRRRILYWHLKKDRGKIPPLVSELHSDNRKDPGPLRRRLTARQWHRNLAIKEQLELPPMKLCSFSPELAGFLEANVDEDHRPEWILAVAEADLNLTDGTKTAIVWQLTGRQKIAGRGVLVAPHQSIKAEVLASIREGLYSLSDLLHEASGSQSLGIIARRSIYQQELTSSFNVCKDMHLIQQWWIKWTMAGNQVKWFTQSWSPGRSPYQAAKLSAEHILMQARRLPPSAKYTALGWCKRHISFTLNNWTREQLDNADKGRAILDLNPPMGKGHFPTRKLQRTDASRVNQFLANHFPSKAYLSRFHCTEDVETCVCGQEVEDRDHLLYSCPRFHRRRMIYGQESQAEADQSHPLWNAPHALAAFLEEIAQDWQQQGRTWH